MKNKQGWQGDDRMKYALTYRYNRYSIQSWNV